MMTKSTNYGIARQWITTNKKLQIHNITCMTLNVIVSERIQKKPYSMIEFI